VKYLGKEFWKIHDRFILQFYTLQNFSKKCKQKCLSKNSILITEWMLLRSYFSRKSAFSTSGFLPKKTLRKKNCLKVRQFPSCDNFYLIVLSFIEGQTFYFSQTFKQISQCKMKIKYKKSWTLKFWLIIFQATTLGVKIVESPWIKKYYFNFKRKKKADPDLFIYLYVNFFKFVFLTHITSL